MDEDTQLWNPDGKGLLGIGSASSPIMEPARGALELMADEPLVQPGVQVIGDTSDAGGGALGPITDMIFDMNGTLYFVNVNAAITGPV